MKVSAPGTPRPSPALSFPRSRVPCCAPAPPAARNRSTRRSAASDMRSTGCWGAPRRRLRRLTFGRPSSNWGRKLMRLLRVVALVGTALSLALFVAPAASASVEVGSDCEASGMVVGATLFPLVASPDNQLPISPTTGGIATKWKVRSPGSDVHTEKLKVFRPEFGSNQIRVVAESGLQGVTNGHETFDIRIPVQAGDRFGATGKVGEGAIACIPN